MHENNMAMRCVMREFVKACGVQGADGKRMLSPLLKSGARSLSLPGAPSATSGTSWSGPSADRAVRSSQEFSHLEVAALGWAIR